MAKRLIGSGVTDSNGVVSIPYTGTGRGKLQIRAESGILQSEICELMDLAFWDKGTASEHKETWYNYNTILTVDYPTQYDATRVRKLENNTTQRYYYYNDTAISTTKVGGYNSITNHSTIEFDVISYVGTIQLALYDGTNTAIQEINANGHYKIVCNGSTTTFYKDDVALATPKILTGSNFRFGFGFNASNEGIVFKDFKIYPI